MFGFSYPPNTTNEINEVEPFPFYLFFIPFSNSLLKLFY